MVELRDYQLDAIEKMKNGCILCGGVGSGKSRTALAYFFNKVCGGCFSDYKMTMPYPRDIYIITTAKKRDTKEWLDECKPFHIFENEKLSINNIRLTVDSWNNIKKYVGVYGAFFIFDEQRVVGYGSWTKSFLKIANKNQWILLSATPGDVWMDYCPVFIANGFYKNKTDFSNKHVRWARNAKFPKIDGYYDQGILTKHRNDILVHMSDSRDTNRNESTIIVDYDKEKYRSIWKDRWNIFENKPIKETGKLFYLLRRVVNEDPDRVLALTKLLEDNPKVIIFYNFNYELDLIKNVLENLCIPYSEWNGRVHNDILDGDRWAYLVQYNAGSEGWNCITTNVMIFYSQNYSYRMTEQAAGRIDRMNTPFKNLFYYKLRSQAPIDIGIKRALANKRNFNERSFMKKTL